MLEILLFEVTNAHFKKELKSAKTLVLTHALSMPHRHTMNTQSKALIHEDNSIQNNPYVLVISLQTWRNLETRS